MRFYYALGLPLLKCQFFLSCGKLSCCFASKYKTISTRVGTALDVNAVLPEFHFFFFFVVDIHDIRKACVMVATLFSLQMQLVFQSLFSPRVEKFYSLLQLPVYPSKISVHSSIIAALLTRPFNT